MDPAQREILRTYDLFLSELNKSGSEQEFVETQ